MPVGPNGERLPYPGDPGFGMAGAGGGALAPEDAAILGEEEDDPELASAGGGGDPLEFLRAAIEDIQSYIDQEDDDVNMAEALKLQAGIQRILANEQKAAEAAGGVTPAAKFVSRSRSQQGL